MTELFRTWILSLTATAFFCSVAMTVMPKGRAAGVLRLVCGIALSLALIAPLIKVNLSDYTELWSSFSRVYQDVTAKAEKQAESLYQRIIEEECAAYIWDKAERYGIALSTVSVTLQWDEVTENWLPYSVSICTVPDVDIDPSALIAAITDDLGIPMERQEWKFA